MTEPAKPQTNTQQNQSQAATTQQPAKPAKPTTVLLRETESFKK